jgi:tetratricopeptide (TPR) repeat protein
MCKPGEPRCRVGLEATGLNRLARSRKARKPQPVTGANSPGQSGKPSSAKQERREKGRERARARKTERLVVAVVLLISALAFVNSLNGEFVYDDRFQVLNNPTINTLGNIPRMFTQSVWQFMNSTSQLPVGAYYRPIFNIALIINHQLFGSEVFGWHLVSLLLHLTVVFLVYMLGRQWDLPGEAPAAAALLFGLHPTHCESVAWVSGLPDPLAAVFVLSSVILYERNCRGALSRWPALAGCAGLALLAMLCKEVAIVFPVFIALREWQDRSDKETLRIRLSRVVRRSLPFLAAAVVYIGLRYAVLGFISKAEPKTVGVTGAQVLLTIPSALLSYARLLFVPFPLAITYPIGYVASATDPRFWAAALAVLAMVVGTWWLVRSSAAGQKALLFLILFLLPVLNLKAFNPQESLIHDRYLYLPSVGFCMLIALGMVWLCAKFGAGQIAFRTATALIAGILLLLTVNQNQSWQNDLVMARGALKLNPQSPFLLNYIGAYYSQRNQTVAAEQSYLEALGYDPKYYDALSNLGDLYRTQGRLTEAEQNYLKAIEYAAPYADTHYNLGVTYTSQGRYEDATRALLDALDIQPSLVTARYNLGWNYDQLGKTSLAEQAYVETLQYKPSYAEPRINLGVLLTKQGRYDEALAQLQTAKLYAPDHQVLLYALGDVLMKLKRYDDAIAQFKQLIQRDPQNKLVYTSLGLCYEGLGNKGEAKIQFEKAIEVAPQDQYTNTAREHLAKL